MQEITEDRPANSLIYQKKKKKKSPRECEGQQHKQKGMELIPVPDKGGKQRQG